MTRVAPRINSDIASSSQADRCVPVLGVMASQAGAFKFLSWLTGIESSRCFVIDQDYFLINFVLVNLLKVNVKIHK